MSTFAKTLVDSLKSRWEEIDVLIDAADKHQSEPKLFDALCRSTIVLMTAHFEGFIKECLGDIVDDANSSGQFKDLPPSMKRAFSKYLVKGSDEKDSKNLNSRVEALIAVFNDSSPKLNKKAFLIPNQPAADQDDPSVGNPTPAIINSILKCFINGSFFAFIDDSDMDVAFKGSMTDLIDLQGRMLNHIDNGLDAFPYDVDCLEFKFSEKDPLQNGGKPPRTFWEEFLDEIFRQRHLIAHGASVANTASLSGLGEYREKLRTLQYAILIVLCFHVTARPTS